MEEELGLEPLLGYSKITVSVSGFPLDGGRLDDVLVCLDSEQGVVGTEIFESVGLNAGNPHAVFCCTTWGTETAAAFCVRSPRGLPQPGRTGKVEGTLCNPV